MLKNYFKIAWRNLMRNKGYTFINISGLSMGMACCILIGLYVKHELSYDDFHENADRTYRVLREYDLPDLHTTISNTPPSLAPALEASVPGVEKAVRIARTSGDLQYGIQTFAALHLVGVLQGGPQEYAESGFVWADQGFFEIFPFPMLSGEPVLARPGTVVLTEAMATKYFPNENPVGQTLQVDDHSLEVTGVMANVPSNSHLNYIDFVGSMKTLEVDPNWGYNNFATYVLLTEGSSKSEVAPQVDKVIRENMTLDEPVLAELQGSSFIPHLQPITGIHLGQGVSVEIDSAGNILYVFLFATLAIFILLLACINFMNLATARSTERAGEVGIRKTLGAWREQLVGQFLGESVLMSMGALILALVLCHFALPLLNQLAGKSLALGTIFSSEQVLVLVGLAVFTGLAAGSYPALVLSGFEPSRVLKGNISGSHGSRWLRKGLVVFQFAISIAIFVGTGAISKQLVFMRGADLGFKADNLMVIEHVEYIEDHLETFEQEIEQLPGVQGMTSGFSMPGGIFFDSMWRPAKPGTERQNMNYAFVGWDYIETLDIETAAGRSSFSRARDDTYSVMLNEAAAQDFGWTAEEAIGKRITRFGNFEYTVVGVVENFHYESLHAHIDPLVLYPPHREQHRVAVRVQPENLASTLPAIRGTWEQFSDLPFRYSFLAADLAAQYRAEERLAKVFSLFAGLAILIACLGLFGLAAYTAQRRTKEIGIRKVLGATVTNIVGLLSKDFLKLVLLGFVIAIPIAWFAMNRWLQDFAYRIDIGPEIFLLAGALAVLIALATVSWQSVRAALANPTDSLRSE